MKISIITVCFNSVATIEQTFVSIQNQTYENVEYIVVDGGSKDGTDSLIKKYKNIISTYITEQDKGLYDALNKGLSIATGDIVGILNSDDVFKNDDVLENVAKFHLCNNVDASISNVEFHKNGKVIRNYSAKGWRPEMLKLGYMPPHPGIFLRRSLFEKFEPYRIDFLISADYELVTRFFCNYKISWKFHDITTHSMSVGGLSSSGFKSYVTVSIEFSVSLNLYVNKFSYTIIYLRLIWKVISYVKIR